MSSSWMRALAGAATVLGLALLPAAASAAPGDATMQIKVGDDVAGGKTELTFERVYSGQTPTGTPVYIYVPQGGIGHPEVKGINPQFDPNPNDQYKPCADNTVASHTISQAQINTLGNELSGHIVGIDEAHYMPIQPASSDPASKALVVLAYNIIDGAYYDCEADQYTVGYFAPDFLADYGMNTIVIDTGDWDELVGNPNTTDLTMEGVIAHELQHLLHNQSDAGEMSWVDEGLADFAIFLNGYPVGGSHATYHQVFHRETSLTRWGGGLENYGASFTFFQYLWEQAGGNGDGTYNPDGEYDGKGGDLLIKKIFENQADGMEGVQAGIDAFNAATTGPKLRSARELFEDWAVTVYLDDERSNRWNIRAFNFGDPATTAWTIDLANNQFFGGRDVYQGAVPYAKYQNRAKRGLAGTTVALPYSTSYQSYRNPGPTFSATLDGADTTTIAPHTGAQHWYAGYESQSDHVLDVAAPSGGIGGQKLDFWDWHFIEEGWDYGFVEALVGGQWVTVPLTDDAGKTVTTNDNPQGNNTEGNGLTGTSGGAYFVDEPKYIHLNAVLPAGATDVRFRYSTDAAYLDTGWFVDDVKLGGADVALSSAAGEWFLTNGQQDNNWVLQVISPCDLTPSGTTAGELVDNAGNHVYRFEGDDIRASGFNSKCLGQRRVTTVISNLPTGDLQVLDAPYTFSLRK